LDKSAVHPESYSVVQRIAEKNQRTVDSLIGDSTFLRTVQAKDYACEQFGLLTVQDIIRELDKPGRDPRPEFKTASFRDGVEKISDLQIGMVLEGVVTNVANFGAFVDVGVHQDGLVHISAITNRFIKDPREAVKTGDIVKVKVLEVDAARKRIALTMRLDDETSAKMDSAKMPKVDRKTSERYLGGGQPKPAESGTMGDLLRKAMEKQGGR